MVMVSLSEMLVKSKSTSRLLIYKLLSCSTITLAKEKESSLIVNSLIAMQLSFGTRNFAILCVGIPNAEYIGLKIKQILTIALRALHRTCKISGLDTTALVFS